MGTREKILAAAAEVMREQGYARATTKEIARAAGFSEAALYKHFADKTEIFLGVMTSQLPGLEAVLGDIAPGRHTVRGNLVRITSTAIDFYTESFPIGASLFSSRDLLAAHRAAIREHGAGPRTPVTRLANYLRAERDLGRLPSTSDPDAIATLLLGAAFQQGFLRHWDIEAGDPTALARKLVKAVLP
ncbi:TetR/AcrR family transcriptional regulator [Amycolatopsis methanolica]|uniref:TetR family transcriptional regulator n=1 Tax=Amycolatopsis methanolica 239 TaxID=1068978 RepID=A0A076MN46_AMYME|nr:TetR/AcrR family transcriptional regulator [Amycolatopsis methanolica]AIJ20426.1 TetR family transcriptional regulator [Amycolatopsis methanolica 239]